MDYLDFICLAVCLFTLALIILVCELLNLRPYKRIKNKKPDNGPINAAYTCTAYCPHNIKLCCRSCAHKHYCRDTCEDYNGPCNVRRLINGEHKG